MSHIMKKYLRTKLIISLAGLMVIFAACLKEKDSLNQPYKGNTPVDIEDGWTLSDPATENIDSESLDAIYREVYADKDIWMMKSLLVFRNGKLVAESYLKDDADRIKPDAIWSCTKQINSIITGIAIERGLIGSIHDSIDQYLPEYTDKYPDKKNITIEHLLTMRSGIAFDNGNMNDIMRKKQIDNSLDYILNLDMSYQSGEKHFYKDSDPHLLSAIVQKVSGKPMDEFGDDVLFSPLGIRNYKWNRYTDGITLGSWGILTTPRELAKVAQCVMNNGVHNGQQVIPSGYLHDMLSIQVPEAHNELDFGYLWWIDSADGIYFTWGHGGQYAFIIPSLQMMVVITSYPQVDDDVNIPVEDIISIVKRIAATVD
jgi:CubicO group peptidase (beta-lactamase class C family)